MKGLLCKWSTMDNVRAFFGNLINDLWKVMSGWVLLSVSKQRFSFCTVVGFFLTGWFSTQFFFSSYILLQWLISVWSEVGTKVKGLCNQFHNICRRFEQHFRFWFCFMTLSFYISYCHQSKLVSKYFTTYPTRSFQIRSNFRSFRIEVRIQCRKKGDIQSGQLNPITQVGLSTCPKLS